MLFHLLRVLLHHFHLVFATNLANLGEIKPDGRNDESIGGNDATPRSPNHSREQIRQDHAEHRQHNGGDQAEPPDATQFFIALGGRVVEHAVELGLFCALLLLDGLLLLRGVAARLDVDARGGFALGLCGRSGLFGLALDLALIAVVHRITLRHLGFVLSRRLSAFFS